MKKIIGFIGFLLVLTMMSCSGSNHASCPAYGDDFNPDNVDKVIENQEKA